MGETSNKDPCPDSASDASRCSASKEDLPENIRHELALLCRRKGARSVGKPPDDPPRWRPNEVRDPACGMPFTEAGAWEFVGDLFGAGHPVEKITLRRPPGKVGYAMVVRLKEGELYIKVRLGTGSIIGRSFHYSERPGDRDDD